MVGVVLLERLVAEPVHGRLVGHVAGVGGHPGAGRRAVLGSFLGDGQPFVVDVTGRDRATLGRELDDQLSAHP